MVYSTILDSPPKDLSQSAHHDIIYKYSLRAVTYQPCPRGDVTEFTFFVYTKGNKRLKTNDRALASSWTNNQRINSIDNQKNKIKEAPCGCLFSVQFKRPSNKSGRFHPQRKKMLLAQAKFHRVNKYKKM